MSRDFKDMLLSRLGSVEAIDVQRGAKAYKVPLGLFVKAAKVFKEEGLRLAAEWATDETPFAKGYAVYAAYECADGYIIIKTDVPLDAPSFPTLSRKYPQALRFERRIHSLMGIVPEGHPDPRPWIKHEDWPLDTYPLRKSFDPKKPMERVKGEYRFIMTEGEGVYEIPVGPVHAGIIEPGHFRFSAAGEDVISLEEKLGYVHKGIEKRFEGMGWVEASRLACRVSGDSAVAHSLAYAMAVEALSETELPQRAEWLRAIMLERERAANHLNDIGAICNDTSFTFMLYQMAILRERLLRTNKRLFGHRLMMDCIVPGGVVFDLRPEDREAMIAESNAILDVLERLVIIYEENASLADRVHGAGILSPEIAKELGVVGFVARASGQPFDCRVHNPFGPYKTIVPKVPLLTSGDVHARTWVRIEELRESLRLIKDFSRTLPNGSVKTEFCAPSNERAGFSTVEGWRGEVIYWIECGPDGGISRCMARDPSDVNWVALEYAIKGNIVPDFPLCNKSFNQSYSGNDL
ncbi:MAG: NADH-quinone oxidoreductase subunit C [Deltaproteobacteria bacterium]|nr:NADH-quinone oxidoreductase subunit C [Deltaproteobacteria bacterium]